MTWEELVEKAKKMGYNSSYYLKDDVEVGFIYCNDYIYLDEDGEITTETDNIVATNRTPDQMYQIMLALKD